MSVGRALNDRQFLHGFLLVVCEGLGHRCEVRLQAFVVRLRCTCLRHDNELHARAQDTWWRNSQSTRGAVLARRADSRHWRQTAIGRQCELTG